MQRAFLLLLLPAIAIHAIETDGTWFTWSRGNLNDQDKAVVVTNTNGENCYVCRAGDDNVKLIGTAHEVGGVCYFARGGSHTTTAYEVLQTSVDKKWVNGTDGSFPWNAMIAGYEAGMPSHICRAILHDYGRPFYRIGYLTRGSHHCVIEFHGENKIGDYDILVRQSIQILND